MPSMVGLSYVYVFKCCNLPHKMYKYYTLRGNIVKKKYRQIWLPCSSTCAYYCGKNKIMEALALTPLPGRE